MKNVCQRRTRDGLCNKVCKRFRIDAGCNTGCDDGVKANALEQARRIKRLRSITAEEYTTNVRPMTRFDQ